MKALATVAQAKQYARHLRRQLQAQGHVARHGRCLEMVALEQGYKDWNALHAVLVRATPVDWVVGGRIQGRYRLRSFTGTITGVSKTGDDWFCLKMRLDQAIDVVTFDSFSNFRRTILGVVDASGASAEQDLNGQPYLSIDIWR